MKLRTPVIYHVLMGSLLLPLSACDQNRLFQSSVENNTPSGRDNPSDPPQTQNADDTGSISVGDVTIPDGSLEPGQPHPLPSFVQARVRNESSVRANITIHFIDDRTIAHSAFVRVMPRTITTAAGPKPADVIEISGVNAEGRSLGSQAFTFGKDFDESNPAEFVILDPNDQPTDPIPIDPIPAGPLPVENPKPTIAVMEPAVFQTVTLGTTFTVRWEDTSAVGGALVRIFLIPSDLDVSSQQSRIPISPAIEAGLDGINDEFTVVVENIEPGTYIVMAEIDDRQTKVFSVAHGMIEVLEEVENQAPSLVILTPSSPVTRRNGETLSVIWEDDDPDDNASIVFSLEATPASGGLSAGKYTISQPIAEDPDAGDSDRAVLPLAGILPGRYDLVGLIDDGQLSGSDRVNGVLTIIPEPVNDPPTLVMYEPVGGAEGALYLMIGDSMLVSWADSDANDNAQISLMLEPDVDSFALNGNELVLAGAISEDPDVRGDQVTLGIPDFVEPRAYRVVGVITDGLFEVVAYAPAIVFIAQAADDDGDGDDEPQQAQRIVFIEPAIDIATRMGEEVPIRLQLQGVLQSTLSSSVRLFMASQMDDETFLRVEVTPPEGLEISPGVNDLSFSVPDSYDDIPHQWFPRNFMLTAEVTIDGERYAANALGAVWVRREIMVHSVKMLNYYCFDRRRASISESPFEGLEIEWSGGGWGPDVDDFPVHLQGLAGPAPVQFWVTLDDVIPLDDPDGDEAHRMILETVESFSTVQLNRVSYFDLMGFEDIPPQLDNGSYQIVTVVSTIDGPMVTLQETLPIEVCWPRPVIQGEPPP